MLAKINIEKLIAPYEARLRAYVLSLRDIRNVGVLVFIVIVLLISWSGVKSIQTNYGLQKQIVKLGQENQVAQLENTNQALQNQYYGTPQYLEIAARQNLGLAAPGETELIISKETALAHTIKMPGGGLVPSEVPKQPFWQRNFEAWMNFFLHRDASQ